MNGAAKDTRSEAEKEWDTRRIIGSWMHEGYVPTPEAEEIHQRARRGEISSEQAIALFAQRALELDRKLSQARAPT